MKKILSHGIVMFAGIVSVPATSSHADQDLPGPAAWHSSPDPRLGALRRFFHASECPVEDLSQVFVYESDKHHLDWRLLPSLAIIESGGGKAYRGNNLFGWDQGDYSFDTLSEGIHEVARHLATSRLYRDKDLDAMLGTYNSHPGYCRRVKMVMRRISAASNN